MSSEKEKGREGALWGWCKDARGVYLLPYTRKADIVRGEKV